MGGRGRVVLLFLFFFPRKLGDKTLLFFGKEMFLKQIQELHYV